MVSHRANYGDEVTLGINVSSNEERRVIISGAIIELRLMIKLDNMAEKLSVQS